MAAIMVAATSKTSHSLSNVSSATNQRKKATTTVSSSATTNSRKKSNTPKSNTKAKRKPNRKTKSTALVNLTPMPPPVVLSKTSTGLSDGMEDEDEDICPVCDTVCTCNNTVASPLTEQSTVIDTVSPISIGSRPAGKAIPWSVKTTLAKTLAQSNGDHI
ncbi:hypothetical protein BDF19DRAFT_99485 [Syncephalis fuscata]|nr:hypothetical protein BDF19DRAFT_99485 [Syncephalis fuscata]